MKKGFIFDLDGVIVDTAHFHYNSWRKTAEQLGFELTIQHNEKLKGVSRIESLNRILDWAQKEVSQDTFQQLMFEKNEDYLRQVVQMTASDILPGVFNILNKLKSKGYGIALGSASKNAPLILEKVGLSSFFNVIVDGNRVIKAKPDPEVFIVAAQQLGVINSQCVVFEDAEAGIESANTAGMISVGLGNSDNLEHAKYVFQSFESIELTFLEQLTT